MKIDDDDEYAELFRKLPGGSSSGTSWRDVAAELEALGGTLGDVLRSAWRQSDGDALLRGLREALGTVVDDVNRTADSTAEGRHARDELTRLVESLRTAAAQAGDEVRPELLDLLRKANAELRRVSHLDEP
jgi:hypothetical protein